MRLLFYLVIGYVVWKIIQLILQSMAHSRRNEGGVSAKHPGQNKADAFKDIKDADFEELPPDEKK